MKSQRKAWLILTREKGKQMYKVLVADEISQEGIELLSKSLSVTYNPKIKPDELLDTIGEYDGLLVRSRTTVPKEVIKKGKKLRVIGRAGVGVDNIDVIAATECGIVVLNSPEGNTASAAEHTVALMMSLARGVSAADRSVKEGKWERNRFIGSELFNKTLAVVGLGRVGARVAATAQALGMKVIVYDPLVTAERAEELNVQKLPLEEIWPKADFITLHTPKTPETTNMINASVLSKMKSGVRIINAARGGIVDEAALATAIEEGRVAGAAFDVYDQEPPIGSPLLGLTDKVVLTPHLGASTQEAQFNVAIDLAEQIRDYLNDGVAKSPVNLPSMRPEFVKELGKYIWLAEAMGTIASELKCGDVLKLEVISGGDLATKSDAPLLVAALRGMLARRIEGVTYVNAQLIARNKGIQVVTSKSNETTQFNGELRVIVTTEEGATTLAGTILANDEAMITDINSLLVNLYLVPMMLFTDHKDEPGVVAKVASVLAKHDVNISNMSLARNDVRSEAVMVMGIDDILSKEVLTELASLSALKSAHFVSLTGMSRHP
jgi:D-3-phosphoglycerate dehydrogenase / 2-oxoglutarate reductase